jgi:hypothetical protein
MAVNFLSDLKNNFQNRTKTTFKQSKNEKLKKNPPRSVEVYKEAI